MEKKVIIKRKYFPTYTIGEADVYTEDQDTPVFSFKTLELPWKENQRRISCIPEGEYDIKLTGAYGNFPYKHYDILEIDNRDGVKIHAANYVSQLRGCISVGKYFVDMDKDGKMDVTSSRATLKWLVFFVGKEAKLIITHE